MDQLSVAAARRARGPGAREICGALREQIRAGVYGTAGLLPSSRALAAELGVSRTTVTVAYEQLLAEGFITVRHGARARVAAAVVQPTSTPTPGPTPRPVPLRLSVYGRRVRDLATGDDPAEAAPAMEAPLLDFRHGDLAPSDFPAALWKRAMNAAMARRPDRLAYTDPAGSRRLRSALQGYLWRARTLRCAMDQIVIVNGAQQGLDLCARLLLEEGGRFVIEDPGYDMARRVFAATGATPVPIPADRDGLDTGRLAGVEARLAYVTPSHQFPLGGVLPVARRHQLLDWARRQDAHVVEDDYDSEYRFDMDPVPPLHGLDGAGRVIYLGTISKTLSPTLRLGYLVVPPDLQPVFAAAKRLTDRHSPSAGQEALAALIESGAYEGHVRRVRRLHRQRREALLDALRDRFGDRVAVAGAEAGLHIVAWFDGLPRSKEAAVVEAARCAGVGVHPISPLYDPHAPDGCPDRVGLVMGYAALDPKRIERGVRLLAGAVDQVR